MAHQHLHGYLVPRRLDFRFGAMRTVFLFIPLDLHFQFIEYHIDGSVHLLRLFLAMNGQSITADVDFGTVTKFLDGQNDVGFAGAVEILVQAAQFVANVVFQGLRGLKVFKSYRSIHWVCFLDAISSRR